MTKLVNYSPLPDFPAGLSLFPREIGRTSRRWTERHVETVIHFNELQKGNHSAALEQPELFAGEVVQIFRPVR